MPRASPSSADPLRNTTPSSAARPVATMMAVGVRGPWHTDTRSPARIALRRRRSSGSGRDRDTTTPRTSVTATATTTGTNTLAMRSASSWMGGFDACASSTDCTICASSVSPPTRVARHVSDPWPLTVPARHRGSRALRHGLGSPVIIDSSTKLSPKRRAHPRARAPLDGRSRGHPCDRVDCHVASAARRTRRAVLGARPSSRRMADDDRPLAMASMYLPARMSVTMLVDASKYVCAVPGGKRPGASSTAPSRRTPPSSRA